MSSGAFLNEARRFSSRLSRYTGQTWLADSPALPLPHAALSMALSMDDDEALSNQDEDIDPALDALDEGFIGTAAPICPPSIG